MTTTVNGTLNTMSVPDLLQWLLNGGKSGALSVVSNGVRKCIYFLEGAMVGASSSDPDLAFGQFLLDLGKIDEKTLVSLVQRQRETGVMLGRLLTTEGLMTEEEVREVLQLKARETLFELMAWREGDFEFAEGAPGDRDKVPFHLPIDRMIFEGIRKAEERRRVREAFPSGNVVPTPLSDEAREALLADPNAAPMVSLMDMGKSLRELARELRMSVVEVGEILYPYLNEGHLMVGISGDPDIPSYYVTAEEAAAEAEAVAPESTRAQTAPVGTGGKADLDRLCELSQRFLEQGQLEEAMATIDRALRMAPDADRVRQLAGRIQDSFVEDLWSYFDDGSRVPVLAVGLRDLPEVKPMLTSEEAYVATRITGSETVRELVDMIPLPELQTLQILRVFADAELIIFK